MILESGAFIVSWDFSHDEDKAVLIVGKQVKAGNVEIVNAFQGDEAKEIYKKLTTKKGE